MTYLMQMQGHTARIHSLPGREPFMLAADLAEIYGTEHRRVSEAVKRNLDRFPDDFAFHLTLEEADRLPQNATTSPGQRTDLRPLVFTHAGALALSGVLKTPVAAQVSVIVHRGFAAMERHAFEALHHAVIGLRIEAKKRSPLRVQLIDGAAAGLSFDAIWRLGRATQPRLAHVARECLALGLIDALPEGTPPADHDLFVGA